MKYLIYSLIILFFLTILLSCEEVIDIDLNEANPEFVIEAIISKDSTSIVRLTLTSNYFDIDQPVLISNAEVSISDSQGGSELLTYIENGYYEGTVLRGTEDTTYDLEVLFEEESYSGQAYMPPVTEILSISFSEPAFAGGPESDKLYELELKFSERPDVSDFYMIRYIQNDILLNDFYTLTSDFIAKDGVITFSGGRHLFEAEDYIEVQIYSIDENVYDYFSQLNDAISGISMFSTPYNPRTNIENASLGYFAAWAYVSDNIVIE
jgi:hypothetical protein